MPDQMFVFMSLLPLFHLYLYKGQKSDKNILSSGVKGSAFCRFVQGRNQRVQAHRRERTEMRREMELETAEAETYSQSSNDFTPH